MKIALLLFAIMVSLVALFSPASQTSFAVGSTEPALPPVTFTVDRTDDNAAAMACTAAANDCSLRGAIRKSNANVGVDEVIIDLQAATTYNLTLTNATQENAAATGDLDIVATHHPVTIRGGGSSGVNATTISATGLNGGASRDRVFHIVTGAKVVTFTDVIIANGRAVDDGTSGASTSSTLPTTIATGGCILSQGTNIALTEVTMQSCRALGKGDHLINEHTTLDSRGGGLASMAANGSVTITSTKFAGNSATGGNGGNFNNGAGSNASGGSIYFTGGTLNISASRFENSNATGGNGGNQDQNGQTNGGFGGFAQGGGAWLGGGTVTITETTFTSSAAKGGNSGTGGNASNPGGDASGGALYSLANVTVRNSTFASATAIGGNAGHAFGSTCLGGHTGGDGGAARGGAIFGESGSVTVNTATFANNSATGGNGGNGGQTNGGLNCGQHGAGGLAFGGAITNNTATLNIDHSTISLNRARAGNTGVNQGGANKPPRPAAEGTGGGIRVGPASVTLARTIIAGNTAANGLGDNAGAPTPGPDVDGAITSGGHNLLGLATETSGFAGTGDKLSANAALGPLANNGGPTFTMALLAGSAAIDSAIAGGASADQRGLARTFDDPSVVNAATSDGTDIGAYEAQRACDLCCSTNIVVTATRGQRGAIVNFASPAGKGCGRVICNPKSGTFFPVGETIVTCKSSSGVSCSFKVTVIRAGRNPL